MRWLHLPALLSCLALLACATPTPAPSGPPPDWKLASASMSVGNSIQGTGGTGGQISVQIDGHNLNGPKTHLFAGGGVIRGTGQLGKEVQVTIKGEKAEGQVENSPFTCVVETNPDGSAHVTGLMGNRSTDFIISPKQIDGRIAGITYQLTWNGERYGGQMVPGGNAYVSLPAIMATWTNTETACVLSILLT